MSMLPNRNFNHKERDNGSRSVSFTPTILKNGSPMPSKTKQALAPETDINLIVGRFLKTGQLPNRQALPQYSLASTPDLQTALNVVRDATTRFNSLPASLRKELHHDPANFEPWLVDPRNRQVAAKLGLVTLPAPAEGGSGPGGKGAEPPKPTTEPEKK